MANINIESMLDPKIQLNQMKDEFTYICKSPIGAFQWPITSSN